MFRDEVLRVLDEEIVRMERDELRAVDALITLRRVRTKILALNDHIVGPGEGGTLHDRLAELADRDCGRE